jgi:hypothetical protein
MAVDTVVPARRRSRLSRAIAGSAVLVGIVALGTAAALPLNQLTQPGGAVRVADADFSEALIGVDLPYGTWLSEDPSGDVIYNVFELPWHLRLLTEAPAVSSALCLAIASFLVWRICRSRPTGEASPGRNGLRFVVAVAVLMVGAGLSDLLGHVATAEVVAWTGAVFPPAL